MTITAATTLGCSSSREELPPQAQELANLKTRIQTALIEQRKHLERLSQSFVDTAEVNVRLGWLLQDAYDILPRGSWGRWVETQCDIKVAQASNLRRFASRFSRDALDLASRLEREIPVSEFSGTVGPSLRAQIIEVASAANCNSQNGLMRFLRVKGGRARHKERALLSAPSPRVNQSSNGASSPDPFAHLLASLQEVQGELERTDLRTLSDLQAQALECWLIPLARTCARGCRELKARAR
jgi:hypothetical protein